MNKILLVGCGHMGFALLSSWIKKTNFTFTVVDPKNYKKLNLKFRKKVIAYNNLNKINNFKRDFYFRKSFF